MAELYAQVEARGRTCAPARTGGGAEAGSSCQLLSAPCGWVHPAEGLLFPRRVVRSPRPFLLPLMGPKSRSGQEIRSGTTSSVTSVVTNLPGPRSLEDSGKIGRVF